MNFTLLNMATDLRQQLQALNHFMDDVVQGESAGEDTCLAQQMVALISRMALAQALAFELVRCMTAEGAQGAVCPAGCQAHCPWFQASQRIDRWSKEPDFEHGMQRMAIIYFQRGVDMAVNLADYLEASLQKLPEESSHESNMLQTAYCLSSWMRKLVQLLDLLGRKVGCVHELRNKHSC